MRGLAGSLLTSLLGLFLGDQLLCDVPAIAAENPQKFDLKLRWRVGDNFALRIVTDSEGAVPFLLQTNSIGLLVRVSGIEADPDRAATLLAKLTSLDYRVGGGGRTTIPVGDAPPPQPGPSNPYPMAQILGQEFKVRVTSAGVVESVDGLDAMLDRVANGNGGMQGPGRSGAENTVRNVKQLFGDQAVKDTLQQALPVFPKRAVGIGDSWNATLVFTLPLPIVVRRTWTLQSQRDGTLVLAVKSKIDSYANARPSVFISTINLHGRGPQGAIMSEYTRAVTERYDFQGDEEGTVQMDEASGPPVRGTLLEKISGKVTVSDPGIPGPSPGAGAPREYTFRRTISFERQ